MAGRKSNYDAVIDLPFGRIAINAGADGLSGLSLVSKAVVLKSPATAMARQVCRALRAYVRDPAYRFTLPLKLGATHFQESVWRALQSIESGKPVTYGALARRLKTSARAVGGACRRNPVAIVVPCHRVISVSDEGGYMGQTGGAALRMKKWLLRHEAAR